MIARKGTTGHYLSAVGEGANSRPRIKAPQLCDTDELDRTTHAPNRTPRAPFSQPPSSLRGALRSPPQQQRGCETRGLQSLIAAHAMLWPTWRLCSSARRTREHFRSCQSPPGSDRSHGVPCTAILPIRAVLYGSPVAVQAPIDFAAQSGGRRCLLYTCTFTTDCARVGTCNFLTCAR